jgi:D-alanyl-D-alanine dipeptidase
MATLRAAQSALIGYNSCMRTTRILGALLLCAWSMSGCRRQQQGATGPTVDTNWLQRLAIEFARLPDSVPARWRGLIGEYGPDTTKRWFVLENDRRLWVRDHTGYLAPLAEKNDTLFEAPRVTALVTGDVRFSRDSTGRGIRVRVGDHVMPRRSVEPPPGATQMRVTPRRPIDELRREALATRPPVESGAFRPSELVELTKLDSTIRLDIRYATDNNFLGTRVYDEARAFLQKPAAEALVRAHMTLRRMGYALLVHDAYRPWYVTKIFWDATPDSVRWLVANPAQGSKHNRGAAVDLTLFDLETKQPVEMPSTYDETSPRARSDYPGGTAQQRWHRRLLRTVMEHEGFVANPLEWWHFDYKDWKSYPIGNERFDQIRQPTPAAPPAGRGRSR